MQFQAMQVRIGKLLLGCAVAFALAGCAPAPNSTQPPGRTVHDDPPRDGDSIGSKHDGEVVESTRRRTAVEPTEGARSPDRSRPDAADAAVPRKVIKVLRYIDEHGRAPEGYEGGRIFHNSARNGEQPLPRTDAAGRPISYREWDVNPKVPGVNRGAERLVTGSDGCAYYTADHYRTFIKIR